ncbi:MAG TPA: hypothetical protein PK691_00635 [Thermomicrobiales bacterium]|nr:hypothetical protein [Thermomicrobiales bacterium]
MSLQPRGSGLSASSLLSKLVLILIWALATAGIAWLVVRHSVTTTSDADILAEVPAIASTNRQTVGLTEETIAPVVSAEATVVQDGASFVLEAPAQPADLAYKLLDPPREVRALIDGGPAGFLCPWAGLTQRADGQVVMHCAIPADVRVVGGMTGTMVLQMGASITTQALPITAVVGSNGSGQVVVVAADGTTSIKTVQLGASDPFYIQITGGLDPTEQVLIVPTQRDFGQAQQ